MDSVHRQVIRPALYRAEDFFPKLKRGESVVTWAVKVYFTPYYTDSCVPLTDTAVSLRGSKTYQNSKGSRLSDRFSETIQAKISIYPSV